MVPYLLDAREKDIHPLTPYYPLQLHRQFFRPFKMSFLPQGEGWLPTWLLLVCLPPPSLPSKLGKLTTSISGLPHILRQHGPSLPNYKEHARSLRPIRSRNHRPLLQALRYLDHRLCRRPSLRRLQHLQSPGLPARDLGLCDRMGPFHERVDGF